MHSRQFFSTLSLLAWRSLNSCYLSYAWFAKFSSRFTCPFDEDLNSREGLYKIIISLHLHLVTSITLTHPLPALFLPSSPLKTALPLRWQINVSYWIIVYVNAHSVLRKRHKQCCYDSTVAYVYCNLEYWIKQDI